MRIYAGMIVFKVESKPAEVIAENIIIYVSLGLHLQIIKTIATQLIHAVADLPQYSFQRVYISDLSCRVFLDSAAISFLLRWSHDVRASEEGPLLLIGCGKTGLLVSFWTAAFYSNTSARAVYNLTNQLKSYNKSIINLTDHLMQRPANWFNLY